MKMTLAIAAVAILLAGCSSYTEIAPWNSPVAINGGEVPKASFVTMNISYQLFGVIPICTGRPWTSGEGNYNDGNIKYEHDVHYFADEATVDNNLATLRYALDRVGSHRVTQLSTYEMDDSTWSLFLINRHLIQTKCFILEDKE